ncbi:cysteine hydrolase family protein [Paraburkholderia haematera]|uniref:Peroxyureidoacrylate/ureidoacrylate amidohydrolase RutB n=1 Tax=Paraburkholderia haematera TaxID=2793077 RepID=A0ABM8SKR3_9BURK|nr:cysteine hydrolase family protein [Paraburkholderia haematera]CAE6816980.1 Peroxyureidoacrylate/ureidoacrylate amidohydrolase RutB [Paraburkholderia haematera]
MSKRTLRSILGAGTPPSLPSRTTALLVIDFQNEYFTGSLPIPNGTSALQNARSLVDCADHHGWRVVHVQHVATAESPLFAANGRNAEICSDIQPKPGHRVIRKTSVSVFASTDLAQTLKADGVTHLVICGLMTHACVAGAARDAVPAGFEVVVVADACATRDVEFNDTVSVSHDMLHLSALAEIADTFGSVMNARDVLSLSS